MNLKILKKSESEAVKFAFTLLNRCSYSILAMSFFIALVLSLPGSLHAKHASTSVGDFAGGIVASRHNLSTSGSFVHAVTDVEIDTNTLILTVYPGTTEVCVFCHTPHHTETDSAPLWNKTSATTSFTTYGNGSGDLDWDAKTYVGKTTVGDPKWGSLACLTCHDGVTTFDALINRPGKGTGTPDFFFQMKKTATQSLAFDHFNTDVGADGCLNNSCHGQPANQASNFVTSMLIGTDLTDDHPMSIRYRGGSVASLRTTATVISGINMCTQQESDGSCQEELVNGNLWSVAGFINDTATIDDLLRGSSGGATIECSSCHDPHYKNLTNPESQFYDSYNWDGGTVTDHSDMNIDGLFLRRVGGNSDSGVCRTCHAKADAI
jgi:hypothetical protein